MTVDPVFIFMIGNFILAVMAAELDPVRTFDGLNYRAIWYNRGAVFFAKALGWGFIIAGIYLFHLQRYYRDPIHFALNMGYFFGLGLMLKWFYVRMRRSNDSNYQAVLKQAKEMSINDANK